MASTLQKLGDRGLVHCPRWQQVSEMTMFWWMLTIYSSLIYTLYLMQRKRPSPTCEFRSWETIQGPNMSRSQTQSFTFCRQESLVELSLEAAALSCIPWLAAFQVTLTLNRGRGWQETVSADLLAWGKVLTPVHQHPRCHRICKRKGRGLGERGPQQDKQQKPWTLELSLLPCLKDNWNKILNPINKFSCKTRRKLASVTEEDGF